jgi:hypothetical protein
MGSVRNGIAFLMVFAHVRFVHLFSETDPQVNKTGRYQGEGFFNHKK